MIGSDNGPSGAYIFKPRLDDPEKKLYSKFEKYELYKTSNLGVQCFVVYYRDEDTQQMYTFVLRLIPGLEEVLEWDVQLHGIPIADGIGKEVVANWEFPGFQGGSKTFFTDSNGLEMQRRSISEQTREGNLTYMKDQTNYNPNFWTISNSYFPVDSAIAMRDK